MEILINQTGMLYMLNVPLVALLASRERSALNKSPVHGFCP
jgi:hypothetical protein